MRLHIRHQESSVVPVKKVSKLTIHVRKVGYQDWMISGIFQPCNGGGNQEVDVSALPVWIAKCGIGPVAEALHQKASCCHQYMKKIYFRRMDGQS